MKSRRKLHCPTAGSEVRFWRAAGSNWQLGIGVSGQETGFSNTDLFYKLNQLISP